MFVINETTIDNDTLNANVTIVFDDKAEIEVNVPVFYPKSKDEVLEAIRQREVNEVKKYNAAPILVAIKDELDRGFVGKQTNSITLTVE
jgi:predicted PP-loop superfamily ATPase